MIIVSVQTVHRVVCWVTFAHEAISGDKHTRTQLQNGTKNLREGDPAQNKDQ